MPAATGRALQGWGLLIATLAAAYAMYAAAFGAGFQFDDGPNLAGLAKVVDLPSLLYFTLDGEAGPLGRPFALLTFGLQATSWPAHPEDFLRVNTLVHIVNGGLVFLVALQTARLFPRIVPRPEPVAAAVAALWVFQPLLASTSLMVIQRMTSLSATGVLLGVLCYVAGRRRLDASPRLGFALMTTGVVGGTALAALAKESGALLPLYVWVLEATLLRAADLSRPPALRLWKAVFLLGPALLLAGYVAWTWQAILASYEPKPFDMGQRLATQAVILWNYLAQVLAPDLSRLGPFQDDFPVYAPTDPGALVAIGAWAALVAVAVAGRRRAPLVSFAVGWYLVGHLMESTVFSLELYFEHRNYVPSLGPLALVVGAALTAPRTVRPVAVAGLAAYGLLIGWLLYQTTSLWGQPRLAAEMWVMHHPASPRAAQYLAQQLINDRDYEGAVAALRNATLRMPEASDLAMQALQLECGRLGPEEYRRSVEDTVARLPSLHISYAALDALHRMANMALDRECPDLTAEDADRLARTLLENPAFAANARARHHLHHEVARLAHARKDLDTTVTQLELAFAASPNPETAAMMAATLASAGLQKEAIARLEEAARFAPRSPVLRSHWNNVLQSVREAIEKGTADSDSPA
jgi:tetratricopeptide (TPR) repeat protein